MSTEETPAASDSSMVEDTLIPTTTAPVADRVAVRSFEDLYRSEFRHVLGLTFVLTGDRRTAEEVTQDAFAAAYRQWHKVGDYDSPGAWVRRVACNQAASKIRRRAREARALLRLQARPVQPVALGEGDDAFWNAVRKLPARQAQVVALHYLEDLSIASIAEVLLCSEGSVKTHLSRARQTLTQDFQEQGDE